jgi:predicted adenine nucleotide alpha hydrolase (AANH) superfamily ATPase
MTFTVLTALIAFIAFCSKISPMDILIHTCCAPCLIYPLKKLHGNTLVNFFYNPNIHPYEEFAKRKEGVEQLSIESGIDIITYEYNPDVYLAKNAFNQSNRCVNCYKLRLFETARVAELQDFDAFTTTLLSSPFQKHEEIVKTAKEASKKFGIPFYYEDFRVGYRESQLQAIEAAIYRQKYCGCIYSLESNLKTYGDKTKAQERVY